MMGTKYVMPRAINGPSLIKFDVGYDSKISLSPCSKLAQNDELLLLNLILKA